jgi:hypothetical protein
MHRSCVLVVFSKLENSLTASTFHFLVLCPLRQSNHLTSFGFRSDESRRQMWRSLFRKRGFQFEIPVGLVEESVISRSSSVCAQSWVVQSLHQQIRYLQHKAFPTRIQSSNSIKYCLSFRLFADRGQIWVLCKNSD